MSLKRSISFFIDAVLAARLLKPFSATGTPFRTATVFSAAGNRCPANSASETAGEMGIELLTEDEYRALQTLGQFDSKTSSWIATPSNIRRFGGALFCDRRYDHVFVYHNGASSYYAARGFRGSLRV